jgi:hypothetical protein
MMAPAPNPAKVRGITTGSMWPAFGYMGDGCTGFGAFEPLPGQ